MWVWPPRDLEGVWGRNRSSPNTRWLQYPPTGLWKRYVRRTTTTAGLNRRGFRYRSRLYGIDRRQGKLLPRLHWEGPRLKPYLALFGDTLGHGVELPWGKCCSWG